MRQWHHLAQTIFSKTVNSPITETSEDVGLVRSAGFVQTLESPEIKVLRFPGLESPGKRHRSWKTLEKSWNFVVVVLKILLSGSSIAP